MTIRDLLAKVRRAGFEVVVDGRNTSVRRVVEGAELPGPLLFELKRNRDRILDWHMRENREEWTKCKVCLDLIERDHPMWESTDPFWCEKGKCPLKARE